MDVIVRCTLRDQRLARGLTLRQLADISGIHRGTLSKYEATESFMSIERAAYLALLLDCTLDDLYDYEPVAGEV